MERKSTSQKQIGNEGQTGCENCKRLEEIIRCYNEACNSLICNIGFVKIADEGSQDLLNILMAGIRRAIAKAEGGK